MVCFVHDRQFLSKFHAVINKLRQTNEFTVNILRELPKQCCSCSEKRKDMTSTEAEPLLTSLDIDALRLICLRLDLKQYITTNALSTSSKIRHYTSLTFPTSFQSQQQAAIANQFIIQQDNQLATLRLHRVRLEFVTSTTSEEILNDVAQRQYDLATNSSNYLEVIQAINGLWVVISLEDQTRVDIVKHIIQKQWERFIRNINMFPTYTVYNQQQNLLPQVKISKCLSLQRSKIKLQKLLKTQEAKQQLKQAKKEAQQRTRILLGNKLSWKDSNNEKDYAVNDSEDERDDAVEDLLENVLVSTQARLQFLSHRFQNSNKSRRPRTHRRQHILALAVAA